ncbi:hypothetical protein [Variovorax ginsengisoli]|uniref:Uncharacterized protein n=1 Tax=Variovorax ginsengisoli TaxID=363844 RepID=A0ABT9SDK4_9BURK|nr:hypothetical protein [Variovorax ginsengisoli]MDP9902438.1 hypothetical protein [Variovorax ginsengisoli]
MLKPPFATALLYAALAFSPAHADDYGCKVLLCLADPAGPMAQNECRPPIRRFIEGQSKHPKDPFPTCEEGAPAMMRPGMRMFDACPEGTDTLAADRMALQLTPTVFAQLTQAQRPGRPIILGSGPGIQLPEGMVIQRGIGEGGQINEPQRDKVCVGQRLGLMMVNAGAEQPPWQVEAFEQITTMAPAASPRVVDIYISGKLYRSTRY